MIEPVKWSRLPMILLAVFVALSFSPLLPAHAQGTIGGISCVGEDDAAGKRCSMNCAHYRSTRGCQYLTCLQDQAQTVCAIRCADLRAATQQCDAWTARESRIQAAENTQGRANAMTATKVLGATGLGILAMAGVVGMAGLAGVFTVKMGLIAVGVGLVTGASALFLPDTTGIVQGAGSYIENHVTPRLSDAIDHIISQRPD